jgi:hypothetical protein
VEPTQDTSSAVEPTAEQPVAPEVPENGGTLCVNAFADTNANGVKDADEGYMGNVTFTIAQGTQVIGQAVSTGTPTPICFEGLPAGDYQVAQTVPGRLEMTTAGNAVISVSDGQVVGIEFGSRIRTEDDLTNGGETDSNVATPTPEAGAEGAEDGSGGNNLLAFGGVFLLLGAGLLLGGIFVIVMGRRGSDES